MSRLAVSNIAFENTSDNWDTLARHEINQIELAPTTLCPWTEFTSATIEQYEQLHNCKVFSLQSLFYNTDIVIVQDLDAAHTHMRTILTVCRDANIQKITFGSPKARQIDLDQYENHRSTMVQFIKTLAMEFPTVEICMEPNSKVYGCNFLMTLDSTIQFVKDVDCVNVKVQLDVGNFILEDDNLVSLGSHMYLLGAVHISDRNLGRLQSTSYHNRVAEFLRMRNYSGPISIEARQVVDDELVQLDELIRVTNKIYGQVCVKQLPTCLIGYTGFVGANLRDQIYFDEYYNRANLDTIANRHFSQVYFAAMPGSMWYANNHPEDDARALQYYCDILKSITIEKIVLLSTVNVYGNARDVDEDTDPIPTTVYGKNRLALELYIKQHYSNYQIVRLPGLFGPHLKKNIVYDLAHNNRLEHINLSTQFQWYCTEWLAHDLDKFRIFNMVNFTTELYETWKLVRHTSWDFYRFQDEEPAFSQHIVSKFGRIKSIMSVESKLREYFNDHNVLMPIY